MFSQLFDAIWPPFAYMMTLIGSICLTLVATVALLLPLAYIYLCQRAANEHTERLRLEALPHSLQLAFLKQNLENARKGKANWWFSLGYEDDELWPESSRRIQRGLKRQFVRADAVALTPLERLNEMEFYRRYWWNPFLGLKMPPSMREAYEEGELRFYPGFSY